MNALLREIARRFAPVQARARLIEAVPRAERFDEARREASDRCRAPRDVADGTPVPHGALLA
jgi:hypothetical protein